MSEKHTIHRGPHRPRPRTREARTSVIVVACSVLVHVLLLYTAEKSDLLDRDPLPLATHTPGPGAERMERAAIPAPPTCEADLSMAMTARLLVCNTPIMERDECSRALLDEWSLGLTVCNALSMSSEVDLVTPPALEEIGAEMLSEPLVEPAIALVKTPQISPPPIPPPPQHPRQVVEITRPEDARPPENSHFLADHDSSVERETVARGSDEDMVEKPDPARELEARSDPREASIAEIPRRPEKPSQNPDAPEGEGALTMREPGESRPQAEAREKTTAGAITGKDAPPTGAGYEVARGTGDEDREAQEASEGKTGEGGGGGGRPMLPNLRPTRDILERAMGGGSVDRLDNVASGDVTALNASRWKHASFFNRMKRRIKRHWHPQEAYLRRDPQGNVFGVKDRHTGLLISLDTKGKLRGLVIVQPSGVDVLDEAAVAAVRAAAPFPNPPQELVDPKTGLITFPFPFSFDVDRKGNWRLFRERPR